MATPRSSRLACNLAQSALLGDLDGRLVVREIGGEPNVPAPVNALTGRASVRIGATWFPFEPSGHALERDFGALRRLGDAVASNQQKLRLDALEVNQDIYVASVHRGTPENPGALYTVWPEDTPTWLPAAPVAFATTQELDEGVSRQLVLVPWERVQAELGTSMRKLELLPERWEVRGFPTRAELARLEDRR